jgi:Cd2+/Zn2+-exporting ATPase
MTEKTVELEIPLILPPAGDQQSLRLPVFESELQSRKGILKAHLKRECVPYTLCIHYDPNLISLASVERMAEEAGSDLASIYRHEQIPFTGMDNADSAITVGQILSQMKGMLHARVNFAAGLAFVAYDSRVLSRTKIESTLQHMGVQPLHPETGLREGSAESSAVEAGLEPFLVDLFRNQWRIILVVLAGTSLLLAWLGESFLQWPDTLALGLYIISYITGGYEAARYAIPALFKGKFDTDFLMIAAALGAAALGEWAEGAFLLFLFGLGHAGEHYALDRARNAVSALGELMPKTARVLRGSGIIELPVEEVQVGETVIVRPGDRVPVDGEVTSGASAIDQSPITGESVPVEKVPGDDVFAGTINQDAALEVEVTHLAKDNTLARVMQLVAEAQSQQSPTQRLTERITTRFVPAILVLVILVITIPPLLGWMSFEDSFYRGMLLLIAASPCALALGTPAAVLSGVAQAARNGVLIKGGAHLENLGGVSAMAFDKTGTLTQGHFNLSDIVPLNGYPPEEILRVAAAAEQQANHPMAKAVVLEAQARELELPASDGLENIPGRGIRTSVSGQPVLVGSLKLFSTTPGHPLDDNVRETYQHLKDDGKSVMAISVDSEFVGVLGFSDTTRLDVRRILTELRDLGINTLVMLTGDHPDIAHKVADEVGITEIMADLLPEQKLDAISALKAEHGSVAMVGDGVNDAPALATATIGIAMGGAGTAVALETADVALMADDLGKLPFAVGLSRASRRIIRQNLAIALGVIFLLVLSSFFGLIGLSLAVILHEGSSVVVVLNSLRLLRYQHD